MANVFKIILFIVGLILALFWQLSLAPPLGLAFLNLALLGGLIIGVRAGSLAVASWAILVGLIFDLLSSSGVGPYLLSFFIALVLWPYLFFHIFETRSIGKQLLLAAGAVLVFEFALLGMQYLLPVLGLAQTLVTLDSSYAVHLGASLVSISVLFLVFGRASAKLKADTLLRV